MKFILSAVTAFFFLASTLKAQITPAPSVILVPPTLEEQKVLRKQLYAFENDTRSTFRNVMIAESAWSLGNIILSKSLQQPGEIYSYHTTNIGWNSVNLVYSGINALLYNNSPLGTKSILSRSEKFRKIFAIKAGIEGLFLLTGILNLEKNNVAYQGGGLSLDVNAGTYGTIVNMGLLMSADLAGMFLEGKHIEKFRPIVRANQLGFILDLN